MQFKVGEPMFLCGGWNTVRDRLYRFSIDLQKDRKRVLFIDTLNNLNPHHRFFKGPLQKQYFRNISCIRAEIPYDLLARLKTSGNYIKNNRIGALLVNSLNLLFKDSQEHEVVPLLSNILDRIENLTKKHNLMTIIGVSPHPDENTMKAAAVLFTKENLVMV